jgi:hypothetical protein
MPDTPNAVARPLPCCGKAGELDNTRTVANATLADFTLANVMAVSLGLLESANPSQSPPFQSTICCLLTQVKNFRQEDFDRGNRPHLPDLAEVLMNPAQR